MPKPVQTKVRRRQHTPALPDASDPGGTGLNGGIPEHRAAIVEVIEDLIDGVSQGDGKLSAAAKLLFYMLAAGLILDSTTIFDSELGGLAARHELTPDELLHWVRKDRPRLETILGSACLLAQKLEIRRIGRIDPAAAVTRDSKNGLLEPILPPRQPWPLDLPHALRNREARLRRIAEIQWMGASDPPDGSAPHLSIKRSSRSGLHGEQGLLPPPRPAWVSPFSDKLLILSFVIFLMAPLIAYLISWQSAAALHENRRLAPAPAFRTDAVVSWPAKVEAYYDDRFGFRADLVRLYNILLHKYLKASNSDVVFGKDQWIFYARDDIFKDFFGKALFSEDELKRWKEYLENRRTLLARNDSHYLFVIAPDKNTIYPEKLPDYIREHRGQSRVQQLMEYLRRTGSPVDILDLHDALIAAKPQGTLYFPQDTHWNGRGFLVGYQAICTGLSRWFPDITPQTLGRDYAIRFEAWAGGEWSLFGLTEENLKYRSEFVVPLGTQKARKGNPPLPTAGMPSWIEPRYWEGQGRGSLLMFHDSYMRTGALDRDQVPLAEHFARTMLIGNRPPDSELKGIVDVFHPDVVVEEVAERFVANVPVRQGPPAGPVPPASKPVPPGLRLSACSQVETIVGPRSTTVLEPVNATIQKGPSGVQVIATSDDPYLMLPNLKHSIDGISVKITTPAPVVFEAYAISNDDGGAWAANPICATLHAGLNEFLLPMPKKHIERLRLDPGGKKLVYVIHGVRYLSGCR